MFDRVLEGLEFEKGGTGTRVSSFNFGLPLPNTNAWPALRHVIDITEPGHPNHYSAAVLATGACRTKFTADCLESQGSAG
jgi:hypothetical protein